MKIVVFGPEQRVGAWEGDRVIDLNRANLRLPSRLDAFIEAGSGAIESARRAIGNAGPPPLEAEAPKRPQPAW